MNKTETIQSYLNRYPEKGPTELAKLISKETSFETDASYVSSVKTKMKQSHVATPAAQSKSPAKPAATSSSNRHGFADQVAKLKEAAAALGKDEAKKIIDLLG